MNKNITGDKMFAHIDRIFGERKPITADIFLNNYCNNKCPYCTYRRWEFDNGATYMTYENFVKYAEKLISLGVLGFILTGGGEPTISKDFDKITKWLEENKLEYGINTNFNEIKYIKPKYLKVSLDGWDENSYKKSRGVEKYNKVRENIIEYAEWKKENSSNTSLGIQLLAKSVDEVEKFYEANKDLPVDYISIRPMESTQSNYYKSITSNSDIKIQPNEIIKTIERIASLDKRVVVNYKWNFLNQSFDSCIGQWSQIALNELGEVMYCCHKPYEIVGHILDDDILEKKKKFKTNIQMCDVPCRLTGPNIELKKMLAPKKDVNFI